MDNNSKIQALQAVSETMSKFHGDEPIFSDGEMHALGRAKLDYALNDLMEAVRGFNSTEVVDLESRLVSRGLTLGQMYAASEKFISRVLAKKKWSVSDLEILNSAYEWLPMEQQERFNRQVPT